MLNFHSKVGDLSVNVCQRGFLLRRGGCGSGVGMGVDTKYSYPVGADGRCPAASKTGSSEHKEGFCWEGADSVAGDAGADEVDEYKTTGPDFTGWVRGLTGKHRSTLCQEKTIRNLSDTRAWKPYTQGTIAYPNDYGEHLSLSPRPANIGQEQWDRVNQASSGRMQRGNGVRCAYDLQQNPTMYWKVCFPVFCSAEVAGGDDNFIGFHGRKNQINKLINW